LQGTINAFVKVTADVSGRAYLPFRLSAGSSGGIFRLGNMSAHTLSDSLDIPERPYSSPSQLLTSTGYHKLL